MSKKQINHAPETTTIFDDLPDTPNYKMRNGDARVKALRFTARKPWPCGIIERSTGKRYCGFLIAEFFLPVRHGYEPINAGDYIVKGETKPLEIISAADFNKYYERIAY